MANQWFRLYAEFATDSKVQVLTEALQRRYVMLLCLHCNGTYENRPIDEIALSLRVTVDDCNETINELKKRGLLDKNTGKILGWEKRQYISDMRDPTAADRQRRYRERKKKKRNDNVTSRLPESDTDTETEKELQKKQIKKSDERYDGDDASGDIKRNGDASGDTQPTPLIPDGLNLPAWQQYEKYRTAARLKKLTATSTLRQQRWLTEQGDSQTQQQIIDATIRNGWQGLFNHNENGNGQTRQSAASRFMENLKNA